MENAEQTTPDTPNESVGVEKPISKSQLKKLKKKERWLEVKDDRRKASKQKKKERRAERRENGEAIGPSRKRLKTNTMKDSSCKIRVVLDLSLDEYMGEKDITSLTSQIQHSYSANRRADNPLQLYACGLGGRTQERLDRIGDYKGWDVHFREESYLQTFPKESIVYLSSESPNILTSLSEDKVYIIGGLVDHNSRKGLCHRLAEENGVGHAQLPISEYLHLKGRKVLAVNHVFSILLRFTESKDWKQAFVAELPTRKGFAPVFDTEENTEENADNSVPKSGDESNKDVENVQQDETDKTSADSITETVSVSENDDDCKKEVDSSEPNKTDSITETVSDRENSLVPDNDNDCKKEVDDSEPKKTDSIGDVVESEKKDL